MTPEALSALKVFFGNGPASPFLVILALAVVHLWRTKEKGREAWDAERAGLLSRWDAERAAMLESHRLELSASQEARVAQAERNIPASIALAQGVVALQMLSTQKRPRASEPHPLEVAK